MDPNLGLSDKILPDGQDAKPQAKHLQARADYLLKVLAKLHEQQLQLQQLGKAVKAKRVRKPKAVVSKSLIGETEDISSGEDSTLTGHANPSGRRSTKASKSAKVKTEDEDSHMDSRTEDERLAAANLADARKLAKKEKRNKKKDGGPMHFTANSVPRAVEIIGDLDPVIFNEVINLISLKMNVNWTKRKLIIFMNAKLQCKEKMRPVRKSLKALDNPEQTLTATELAQHVQQCLLHIGEHIDKCLAAISDSEQNRRWRKYVFQYSSSFIVLFFLLH